MIYASFLTLVFAAVCSANVRDRAFYEAEFFNHIRKYRLSFTGKEFVERLQVFANNFDTAEKHNADPKSTSTMGMNEFAHMTFEEFAKDRKLGLNMPNLRHGGEAHVAKAGERLGDGVNWVNSGAVTAVKNQGQCGSCWSFSTTGALEGMFKLSGNSLTSFSEQNLVSCDNSDQACNGGWMDNAFQYVQKNGGICTEQDYPYVSGNGRVPSCDSSCTKVAGSAPTGFKDVQTNSVDSLTSAVQGRPVSIAVDADSQWQLYTGGVISSGCGQQLDHGVLLVGYEQNDSDNYWLIKNSWGPSWGESGYIRVARGSDNQCGVLSAPSYPIQ
jgi:cathepsin L